MFNLQYQLGWGYPGTDLEHIRVTVTWQKYVVIKQTDPNGEAVHIQPITRWYGLVMPVTYAEHTNGNWMVRAKTRAESYIEDCECKIETISQQCMATEEDRCEYHRWLHNQWIEEDTDAVDSWKEQRGDFDAMMRRTNRKIKLETESEPDV